MDIDVAFFTDRMNETIQISREAIAKHKTVFDFEIEKVIQDMIVPFLLEGDTLLVENIPAELTRRRSSMYFLDLDLWT